MLGQRIQSLVEEVICSHIAVPDPLRYITVNEEPNDLSTGCSVRQAGLPWCWYLVLSIITSHTVLLVELRKSVEIVGCQYGLLHRVCMPKLIVLRKVQRSFCLPHIVLCFEFCCILGKA